MIFKRGEIMEDIFKKPVYLAGGYYSFNKVVSKNLLDEPLDINFYIKSAEEIKNVETFGDILYLVKTEPELFSDELTLKINSNSEEAVNFARKVAKSYKCEIQIADFLGSGVSTLLFLDKEYVYFKNEFIKKSSGINEENLNSVIEFSKIYKNFDKFYFQMKTLSEISKDKIKIEKNNCEIFTYGERKLLAMEEFDTRTVVVKSNIYNDEKKDKAVSYEVFFTPKYFKLLKNGKIAKIYFFEDPYYFFKNNYSYKFDKNKTELKFYNFKEKTLISILKIKDSWLAEEVKEKDGLIKSIRSFTIFGKESLQTLQNISQIEILEIIEEIIKKIDLFPEIDLKKEILDIFIYFQNEILKKEEELKNTREKYIEKRDLFLKKMFGEEK
jgi:hypothetical protein